MRPRKAGLLAAFALLAVVVGLTAVPVSPTSAAVPRNDRFGMVWVNCQLLETGGNYNQCTTSDSMETRAARAAAAGAGYNRWPMYWPDIQRDWNQNPDPNTWDWSFHDAVVQRNARYGIPSAPILLNTPWELIDRSSILGQPSGGNEPSPYPFLTGLAASTPEGRRIAGGGGSECPNGITVPRGLTQPVFIGNSINPNNVWGNFVYHAVNRYKHQGVKVWEMWNEPDWGFFWCSNGDHRASYAQLLRVGYLAAKRADPDATVLFGGMFYWTDPGFFEGTLDILRNMPDAAANNYFFDVVAYHFYVNPYNLNIAAQARGHMASRGINPKPIWVNETNLPLCGERYACPRQYSGTQRDQAAFQLQTMALSYALGIDKVFGFQLYDDGNTEDFGYIRNNGTTREAYTAFQVGARYLRSPTAVSRQTQGRFERVMLDGTPNGRVWVVWSNAEAGSVSVPAQRASAQLIQWNGAQSTITASDGQYTVSVGGRGIELGGTPVLIVETTPPCPTGSGSGTPLSGSNLRYFPAIFRGCSLAF
jgi:hypothetical protein